MSIKRKQFLVAVGVLLAILAVASVLPTPFHKAREASGGEAVLKGSAVDGLTLSLITRACNDCHSNQTRWPWYSHVAPGSWLLEKDVLDGRKFMNLSIWPDYGDEGQVQLLDDAAKQIRAGAMPPARYLALHPEARLTATEKSQLAGWFGSESKRISQVK